MPELGAEVGRVAEGLKGGVDVMLDLREGGGEGRQGGGGQWGS